jgi:hypothetical protein
VIDAFQDGQIRIPAIVSESSLFTMRLDLPAVGVGASPGGAVAALVADSGRATSGAGDVAGAHVTMPEGGEV